MTRRTLEFLSNDAVSVARELLGWRFFRVEDDGGLTGGAIIETEAYNQTDAASHSYHGKTPRTEVMFGPPGGVYVYFTYGMHWCMNIVAGPEGRGEAVLIRAITPEENVEKMQQRRKNKPLHELTNGPAKVCQALGVTGADNGSEIGKGRFMLLPPEGKLPEIQAAERIGIKHDTHRLWRFIATTDTK